MPSILNTQVSLLLIRRPSSSWYRIFFRAFLGARCIQTGCGPLGPPLQSKRVDKRCPYAFGSQHTRSAVEFYGYAHFLGIDLRPYFREAT